MLISEIYNCSSMSFIKVYIKLTTSVDSFHHMRFISTPMDRY